MADDFTHPIARRGHDGGQSSRAHDFGNGHAGFYLVTTPARMRALYRLYSGRLPGLCPAQLTVVRAVA